MAGGWYEHGKCGGVYDYRACYQNYQSGGSKNRIGHQTICPISGFYHPVCLGDRVDDRYTYLRIGGG